jgi:hypothetical protein
LNASECILTVPPGFRSWTDKDFQHLKNNSGVPASQVSKKTYDKVRRDMGSYPSSGAILTQHFLDSGYSVYLHGFSHFNRDVDHHYWSKGQEKDYRSHDGHKEWVWFTSRSHDSKLEYLRPHENKDYLIDLYQKLYSSNVPYDGHASDLYSNLFTSVFNRLDVTSFIDYGSGRSVLANQLKRNTGASFSKFDPGLGGTEDQWNSIINSDLAYTTDVLEHVPLKDIPDLLDRLSKKADHFLHAICTRPAALRLRDGQNAHCSVRSASWWGGFMTSYYRNHKVRNLPFPNRDDVTVLLAVRM